MKKILSVLCALAFIASFACIGASAADAAVTFSLVAAEEVNEGDETVTMDLVANVPEGGNVCSFGIYLDYDAEKLALNKASFKVSGNAITSQTTDVIPYQLLWVAIESLPAGDTVVASIVFDLPAPAVAGDTYEVTLQLDEENMPANIDSVAYAADQIVLNNFAATAVVETEATTTVATTVESTEATTVESSAVESSAVESSTKAETTKAPETSATETTVTTKAPDKSSQTGDMMFVVVAVMVVALGAAVVVKKVNVK